MIRRTILALGLVVAVATAGRAAVVTVTDCAADPHIQVNLGTDSTKIDVTPDDLVLQCALMPLNGTHRIQLAAHDITINGDVIASGATSAVQINAGGKINANGVTIQSSNNNGDMAITSVGDMTFVDSTVIVGPDLTNGGDTMNIECTGTSPACTITSTNSTFKSGNLFVTAVGDILMRTTHIISVSPRDDIHIESTHGNVCLPCDDDISGGNESNLRVLAFGFIDMPAIKILIAENIVITSGVGAGAASVDAHIDLTGATINNNYGKMGAITITADEGLAQVTILDAIIIQEGSGVATINDRSTLPHQPFNNIVGVPQIDQ
jgi:hypothetical protein